MRSGISAPGALPPTSGLTSSSESWVYLEGHGDLVSRLIMGISRVVIWIIGFINLLTKSP